MEMEEGWVGEWGSIEAFGPGEPREPITIGVEEGDDEVVDGLGEVSERSSITKQNPFIFSRIMDTHSFAWVVVFHCPFILYTHRGH